MVVNEEKTVLMCVSAATSFKAGAVLQARDGSQIKSVDKMNILGCTVDADESFSTRVENVRARMRKRTWTLEKLKKKGLNEAELLKVYMAMIWPVSEYACPAWHSTITAEQSHLLERQQTQALKHIYGCQESANTLRKKSGIELLSVRRTKTTKAFAKKCTNNDRFSHWFKKRPTPRFARRSGAAYESYHHPICRTDRRRSSPLNYMRRLLKSA